MTFGRPYGIVPRLRGRVSGVKNRLARARFFRGHGVHSPFVYSIVRQVFMNRGLLGGETALRDALSAKGVSERRALELQNLMTHCGYRTFAVCGGKEEVPCADFWVLLPGLPEDATMRLVRKAAVDGTTVAVMSPYDDRGRERMCRAIVAGHNSTTVDNRGYLLVFNRECLPKQHFKI